MAVSELRAKILTMQLESVTLISYKSVIYALVTRVEQVSSKVG